MSTKLERVERANADLLRQLRQKENELKRVSVRSSLEKDAKRLQSAEEHLKSAYHELEEMEDELAATKDREGKLRYELDVLRNVVNLRDHPELLRAADSEARCRRLETENRSLKEDLAATHEKAAVYYDSSVKASKEADGLRFQLAQLQEEVERSGQYVRELLQEREEFVNESDSTSEAIARCKEELRDKAAHVQSLTATLQARERENRSLQTALDELAEDEEHARRTWSEGHKLYESELAGRRQAETDRDRLQAQCRVLREQVDEQGQRLGFLDKTADAQKAENKQLREQMAQWQHRANEIDAIGRRLSLAEADQQKKSETVGHLEERLAAASQALSERDQLIVALQNDIDTLREELEVQIEQTNVMSRNLVQRVEQEANEKVKLQQANEELHRELAAAKEAAVSLSAVVTHHRHLSQTAAATALAAGGAVSDRLNRAIGGSTGKPSQPPPGATVASSPSRSNSSTAANVAMNDLAISPPTPLPTHSRNPSAPLATAVTATTESASLRDARTQVLDRTKSLRTKLEQLANGAI